MSSAFWSLLAMVNRLYFLVRIELNSFLVSVFGCQFKENGVGKKH